MKGQNICNICGANYEYRNGRWKCPACGAYKAEELSNEEATLFYNAAQKLRICDFDEAEKAYTDIMEKFPNNPNGYWGRLLSHYGIKYEEDFDGRKIPTCYAASIESVLNDRDYLKALSLADFDTKAYFEQQARYIERVRKEWIEKAQKEKPYDIFICYKESDFANGVDRTQDSIAAQELYIHLIEQGYRVFFSRESLREKVGEKYEPYIFNALSTAKVMLVYGSKPEYITSTWLKNEWMRYEKRVQAGEKNPNSLIVACDGFSPSELPKALSSMQCFDATSRSFYTDLDAVLKKIIKGEEKSKPIAESTSPKKKAKKLPIAIASVVVIISIVLCILVSNLTQGKKSTQVHNTAYDLTITADSKFFNKDAELKISELYNGDQYNLIINAVKAKANKELSNIKVLDIRCSVNINEKVTVTMRVDDTINADNYAVFYVSDNGNMVEECNSRVSGGYVDFDTTHFSYYVFAELTESTIPPDDNNNQNPDDNTYPPSKPSITVKNGVLQVAVSADWEPYEYVENGELKGIEIDILKAIAEELNLAIEFENQVFETMYDNLLQQNVDCIIGMQETQERNEFLESSIVMFSEPDWDYIIYTKKGCNDLQEALNTAISKLKYNGTIAQIINSYKKPVVTKSTTINFNSNGGSGSMAAQSITVGESENLKLCSFTKNGYTFSGWATTVSGNAVYTDGASFKAESESEITLCAVWIPNSNSLVFNANGGSGSMSPISVETNQTVALPRVNFTKTGYTFKGWSDSQNGSVQYTDRQSFKMTSSATVTLYAVWSANTNAINFNVNGGSGSMSKQQAKTDETISLKQNTFVREGYTFKGWGTSANGPVVYTDKAQYKMSTDTSVTLYAIWSANTNSITFNANGGSGSMSKQQAKTDETITLKQNSFVCNGYVFKGWGASASGPVIYTDKAQYKVGTTTSVTLYAIWERVPTTTTAPKPVKTSPVTTAKPTTPMSPPSTQGLRFAKRGGGLYEDESYAVYAVNDSNMIGVVNIFISDSYNNLPISIVLGGGFYEFQEIKSITFAENSKLIGIGEKAFSGCHSLKSIEIPKSVTLISPYAFEECRSLTGIEIPEGVKIINDGTFYECTSLASIMIPSGVTSIGGHAFQYCTSLASVTFGKNSKLNSIGDYAFSSCTSLKSIEIPSSVTSIGKNAFYHCTSLTSIEIPNGVTNIDKEAFSGCSSLQTIKIPVSVTSIGEYAFEDCENVCIYYEGTREEWDKIDIIGNYTFRLKTAEPVVTNTSPITATTSPVTTAKPATPTSPISSAGLEFELNEDGKSYTVTGKGSCSDTNIIIGTYNDLPVTAVGVYAFKNCYSITGIDISSSVTSIGQGAFDSCTSLTSIEIPSSITSIGDYAFCVCRSLKSVTFEKNSQPTTIGQRAFDSCNSLTSIEIPSSVTSIGRDAFNGCTSLESVTFEESSQLTSIDHSTFYACSSLTSIEIPRNIASIGKEAFSNCSSLTNVTFEENSHLASIDNHAFNLCSSLTHIELPLSVTSMGGAAFVDCSSLKSIKIPNGVTSISAETFQYCTSLASIEIPSSVTSIGHAAFSDCDSLTDVYYSGSVQDWTKIRIESYNTGLTCATIHYDK